MKHGRHHFSVLVVFTTCRLAEHLGRQQTRREKWLGLAAARLKARRLDCDCAPVL